MKKDFKKTIVIFEDTKIRRHWDDDKELWYFSIIDIIKVLTGSSIPRRYWTDLKRKLKKEGSEVYEKIVQLKIVAEDGKKRETDTATTEISQNKVPKGMDENKVVAREGGSVAGNARKDIESKTGKKVISSKNAKVLRKELN